MSFQYLRTAIAGVLLAAGVSACSQGGDKQAKTMTAEPAPAAASCDTACLESDLDLYLQAIVSHDPKMAPLADTVKYTENAQVVAVGDGLWGTASELPSAYKLTVPDPVLGEIAFHLVMKENGDPIWLAGRLKVENLKITEIEAVVVRKGGGFGNFDVTPNPVWATVLEPAERSSRAVMQDAANRYFDALQDNKADYAPFTDDCGRLENGMVTANNPDAKPMGDGPNIGALSCTGNINSMMWRYITKIDQRRYVAFDEEHGVVSAVVMFNQAGNVDSTEIPGFGTYKYTGAAHRPFNTIIVESFKVVNGKIRQIAATMTALPYGAKSGWN